MSRRQALAGGLAGVLAASAGCVGLNRGSGQSERTLGLTLSREGEALRDRFVVDLSDTQLERDEEAFAAVLDGETDTTQAHRPFTSRPDDPVYTSHEGTCYQLGSVVVSDVTVTRPILRLFEVDDTSSEQTETVTLSDLPSADQQAVKIARLAARARGDQGGVPWGLVQRSGYAYGGTEAIESSTLLSDDVPDRVRYREQTYRIETARERFHESVYEAAVVPVATASERMEAILRARFVGARVARDELSAGERDVLEAARTDGYREAHPFSDRFRRVLERLHKRAYLDGDVRKDAGVTDEGRQMLRYDSTYYDYQLEFVDGT